MMNYALIEDNQVINIIFLSPLNESDFPNAINIDDIPVQIGDTFKEGIFYRNGIKILNREEAIIQKELNSIAEEVVNNE